MIYLGIVKFEIYGKFVPVIVILTPPPVPPRSGDTLLTLGVIDTT